MNYIPKIETRIVRARYPSPITSIGCAATVLAGTQRSDVVQVRWDHSGRRREVHIDAIEPLHHGLHARMAHKAHTQELVL